MEEATDILLNVRVSRQKSSNRKIQNNRGYDGFLVAPPQVGAGMLFLYDVDGSEVPRMIETAPVIRVLGTDGGRLYVQTENSVYQIDVLD